MMHSRSRRLSLLGALICGLAGAQGANAASETNTGTVYTLSPEQKAAIEAQSYDRELQAAGLAGDEDPRRIHGEASVMVGSDGARGVATSVVAPVGKSATVGASFLYGRNQYGYDPYDPYGVGPQAYTRGTYGASDRYGHLERVERVERWQEWRAGRP